MAPTVARVGQLRLFFFSREELRIHIHVAHPDGEAKFWLTPDVALLKPIWRKLPVHGINISSAEVTHVSKHGLWLLLNDEELLVPFEHFPWFRKATIDQLTEVQWPTANHLYWPQLDIDLSVKSIRTPSAFPLMSRVG